MKGSRSLFVVSLALFLAVTSSLLIGQTTTASIQGRVLDSTGAVVPKATVTVTNTGTGYTRTVTTSDSGAFSIPLLPVGDYSVAAEHSGFRKTVQNIHLDLGAAPSLDLALQVGEVSQEVDVTATSEAVEPTRSMVSTVIAERAIQTLPINGRQFIDFALLAPGVAIGDTTSGSTDVIIEPVTKLSFAGQNIHYNFIAVDGADDISTASGVQKSTPSQEAVQEFRVINSDYSTEFGRAVGGIVNIITKSGTNDWHGSLYEYFRNDALDARSILASPGLDELRQNQFGFTIGGPIVKDKTFIFANYEGQRRVESPFYNSVVLNNIGLINQIKCTNFGTLPCGAPGTLPIENLNVKRGIDYDTGLLRFDQSLGPNNQLFARYSIYDDRSTNVSPLNDGFDLPSGFKNNFFRDQSLVGGLNSTLSSTWTNELRMQYAHRNFEFPTVSTAPHLEVSNTFTMGVNRGNPDGYEENRFEFVDNISKSLGRHTLMFGGNFSWVSTTESFPLFYPFEADFGCLLATQCPFSLQAGSPFVMFFERFQAPTFTEPTIDPAVFQGTTIPAAVHDQAQGAIDHTYEGLFIMDKWNATDRLNITAGLRWEGETWPSNILDNPMNNWDPRAGFSYRFGTKWNVVLRAGAGIFHGMIPSPLLMCQIPSCGGTLGTYPGRPFEDAANSTTRLFAFASGPGITNVGLTSLLNTGTYPDAVPFPNVCFPGETTLSQCGFFGDAVIVRFAKNHKMPYGIQNSLGLEFEPFRDGVINISYLGVRGRHLGSFFNVNQPNPTGVEMLHDSAGNVGPKNTFFCTLGPPACPPGTPGTRDPRFAVYFEANSLWSSQYDGLLVNFQKRMRHHWGGGISYTWSKGIDNGPNPSFVLIPQDNTQFGQERALSADHVAHRFVLNNTFTGPTHVNPVVNDWELGMIVTLESPHYFTKFAGFDANGDIFGNNDRVGIEGRNTFKGDSYQSIDMRIARTFPLTERFHLQGMFEAFNLFNTVNVRFFNTVYGAADFCPIGGAAICGPGPFFFEGSPNPNYGTPRAVFNPRQLQFALRLTF